LEMAAQMMRRIFVDFARTQNCSKRGGGAIEVDLSDVAEPATHRPLDLIALDDALKALEKLDPRQSQVVELRFFGGLSLEETAEALKISVGTVRNDWSLAQAWLYRAKAGHESLILNDGRTPIISSAFLSNVERVSMAGILRSGRFLAQQ
jgi:RNA polymerase sigma factor (TIGR02999 family)